jgi:DNA-binding GntR family transcriptional regulator
LARKIPNGEGEHRLNGKTQIASIDCRINRQSFVPFYQQIKNCLLAKIELGQLSNGDLIPSEAQLSGALSVSRGTVRQALYELRVEGYVVREKGRGTFVKGLYQTNLPQQGGRITG